MEEQNCGVCGNQGHGLHFGITACRACSSFFRRTVAERKTYVCRAKSQCVIKKGLRNACRACRFQKCIQAGMKIDAKQVVQVDNEVSSNSTEPSASTTPLGNQGVAHLLTNRDCQTLNRIVEGIYNYKTSERSLFTVNHPDHIFSTIKEFKMINETEYSDVLRESISLMYSLLNEYFPVFSDLSPSNKILIVKTTFYEIQLMYQGMQSIHYFPDEEEDRIYISYGYYISHDLDKFFNDPQKQISAKGLFTPTMDMMLQFVKKMRTLKLTETDVAVLGGIIFSQAMINLDLATEALYKFRNDLFSDYHHYLLTNYGVEESGIRSAEIFCLLLDAKTINFKIQETRAIAKIFVSDFIDHWGSAVGEP